MDLLNERGVQDIMHSLSKGPKLICSMEGCSKQVFVLRKRQQHKRKGAPDCALGPGRVDPRLNSLHCLEKLSRASSDKEMSFFTRMRKLEIIL